MSPFISHPIMDLEGVFWCLGNKFLDTNLDKKSKFVFVVLALFLGGLGIHGMYINDYGLGFIYFIFFWTGIPSLIAFFEAIVIGLRKNDPRFIN